MLESNEKRKTTHNTGFASGGVIAFRASWDRLCKLGAMSLYSSSVQVDQPRLMLRNPPERKARKRYATNLEFMEPQQIPPKSPAIHRPASHYCQHLSQLSKKNHT